MASKLTRWEPLRDMISLREAMDRLFEESFVRPWQEAGAPAAAQGLSVDVFEQENNLVVKAAVPGIKAEDIDISVTGDVLNIKGETKSKQSVEDEKYHRRELRYGSVLRSVRLPIEVDADKAEATFEDGVLTLTFPKPASEKPKTIQVKVLK